MTSGPWKAHKLMMPLIKACYDQDVFSDEVLLFFFLHFSSAVYQSISGLFPLSMYVFFFSSLFFKSFFFFFQAILDWAAEAADRGPDSVKLKEQCKQLIEYLEESEEESDDEDDE